MQASGAADLFLQAYPTMSTAIAQRTAGIRFAYDRLELELRTLTDEITARSAYHAPLSTDKLEHWLTRSKTIRQCQHRANEAIDELARELNETTTTDSTDAFLRELFHPVIDRFVSAAQAFTAAVTTAAASQRD